MRTESVPSPTSSPRRDVPRFRVATCPASYDPWTHLDDDHDDLWFAWSDGLRGDTFFARGAVGRWSPSRHQDPFAAAARFVEQSRAHWPHLEVPAVVGGFSFGEASDAWPELGAGLLWQPEECWFQRRELGRAGVVALDGVSSPPRGVTTVPRRSSSLPGASFPERGDYEAGVARAVAEIRRGTLEKVVLARQVEFRAPDEARFDPVQTLHRLRRAYPRSIVFGVGRGQRIAWVGASPETLVAARHGRAQAQAVAGTVDRGEHENRLLRSEKDRHEHELVAEDLLRRLAPLTRDLKRDGPRLVGAGSVAHLVTDIEGSLEGTLLDAVAALHPTPALGGY
ncbi:MAG: chorismate-binding protein, partial [Myxococcota bacterium]